VAKRLAAEPGIRTNRTEGQVLRTLFELDLMNPNRLRPMGPQDLLGQILLLGRSDADPKDETARGHEVVEASRLVSPKNPGNQQEAGTSDNDTYKRSGDSSLPTARSTRKQEVRRGHGSSSAKDTGNDRVES
jgi:hypothetical protein